MFLVYFSYILFVISEKYYNLRCFPDKLYNRRGVDGNTNNHSKYIEHANIHCT